MKDCFIARLNYRWTYSKSFLKTYENILKECFQKYRIKVRPKFPDTWGPCTKEQRVQGIMGRMYIPRRHRATARKLAWGRGSIHWKVLILFWSVTSDKTVYVQLSLKLIRFHGHKLPYLWSGLKVGYCAPYSFSCTTKDCWKQYCRSIEAIFIF